MPNPLTELRDTFKIPKSVTILKGNAYQMPNAPAAKKSAAYSIDQTDSRDRELYKSKLGTPVYTNISFQGGQYETNTPGVFKSFGSLIYEAVLITVSQAKKIIKTEIQGRDGTVKEYIGMDDYQIQINGIITGPNGHYPIDEVAALKAMLDAPIAIDVASYYLQNLDIHSLVVDEYELRQSEGGYSFQTFSISAISDIPQELRLTNV